MKKYLRTLFLVTCVPFISIAWLNGCTQFDSLDPSEKNDVIVADKVIENVPAQKPVSMIIVYEDGLLMSGPGTDYEILTTLSKGDQLILFEQDDEWFYVLTPDQKEGWIHDDHVRVKHIDRAEYEDYHLELSREVIVSLNNFDGHYGIYQIMIVDHTDWVINFVETIGRVDLKYEKKAFPAIEGSNIHTLDQSMHRWIGDPQHNEFISYNVASDFLSFTFDEGINIPGVNIDPRDPQSVLSGLNAISKRFFNEEYEYRVDSIKEEDAQYVIYYSRMIKGIPIRTYPDLSLTMTPEGKIQKGMFLLADFKEYTKVKVPTGEEFIESLNNLDYTKTSIYFDLPQNLLESGYRITGKETAWANLDKAELIYQYQSKFNIIISPSVILEGQGVVETELENFETPFEVQYRVLTEEEISNLRDELI